MKQIFTIEIECDGDDLEAIDVMKLELDMVTATMNAVAAQRKGRSLTVRTSFTVRNDEDDSEITITVDPDEIPDDEPVHTVCFVHDGSPN